MVGSGWYWKDLGDLMDSMNGCRPASLRSASSDGGGGIHSETKLAPRETTPEKTKTQTTSTGGFECVGVSPTSFLLSTKWKIIEDNIATWKQDK